MRYCNLDNSRKFHFFDTEKLYTETTISHFNNRNVCVYDVAKLITETVIEKIFGTIHGWLLFYTRNDMLPESVDGHFPRLVNEDRFADVVSYVVIRLSVGRVRDVAGVAWILGQASTVGAVAEGAVRQIVQILISINLQKIRRCLCDKHSWALSIVFETDKIMETRPFMCTFAFS